MTSTSCWDQLGIEITSDVETIHSAFQSRVTEEKLVEGSSEYDELWKAYQEALGYAQDSTKKQHETDPLVFFTESNEKDTNTQHETHIKNIDAFFLQIKILTIINVENLMKQAWFQEVIKNEDEVNYFLNKLEDHLKSHPYFKFSTLKYLLNAIYKEWPKDSFIAEQVEEIRAQHSVMNYSDDEVLKVVKILGIVILIVLVMALLAQKSEPEEYYYPNMPPVDGVDHSRLLNTSLKLEFKNDDASEQYFLHFNNSGELSITSIYFSDYSKSIQRHSVYHYVLEMISNSEVGNLYGFSLEVKNITSNTSRYLMLVKSSDDEYYGKVVDYEEYSQFTQTQQQDSKPIIKLEDGYLGFTKADSVDELEFDDLIQASLHGYQEYNEYSPVYQDLRSLFVSGEVVSLLKNPETGHADFLVEFRVSDRILSGSYDIKAKKLDTLLISALVYDDMDLNLSTLIQVLVDLQISSVLTDKDVTELEKALVEARNKNNLKSDFDYENTNLSARFIAENRYLLLSFKN